MNDGKDCQNRGFILEDGNFCVKNLAAGSMRRIRYSEKKGGSRRIFVELFLM